MYNHHYLTALLSVTGITRKRAAVFLETLAKYQVSLEEFWSWTSRKKTLHREVEPVIIEGIKKFKRQWSVEGYAHHLAELSIQPLCVGDARYPVLLQQIADYPFVLFTRGNLNCLQPVHVAVVGSRRPTRYGQWVTQKVVTELSLYQVSIVSGFMVGIDYQAHQTAQVIGGRSVGVLGFGFGKFYPAHLWRAAEEFLAAGQLFITEYPPDHPPHQGQFPARNRIVAGLSAATLVVEAQQRSGSLITAQCALDNNRVVGAVPGQVDSAQSQGAHELIQQGALLVTHGEQIWKELSPVVGGV